MEKINNYELLVELREIKNTMQILCEFLSNNTNANINNLISCYDLVTFLPNYEALASMILEKVIRLEKQYN